jgi:apolipoprotein D and lipocalin family protein
MRRPALILAVVASALIVSGCASIPEGKAPLELVSPVDASRYLGRWYEIARFQHGFEKSIVGATADYSLRSDGQIQVVNSGFKNGLDGKYSEVRAVAWIPDPSRPAALKVKFFGLFSSDYLIFGLDQDNYTWALVGGDSRGFLWFLSRTPTIPADVLARMKAIAVSQGYDLTDLYMVPQKER